MPWLRKQNTTLRTTCDRKDGGGGGGGGGMTVNQTRASDSQTFGWPFGN